MKWKINIEIEGKQPTPQEISEAKSAVEEALITLLPDKIQFLNTKATKA